MKDNLFSIKNFIRRFSASTPSYFKKLIWLSVTVGAIGTSIYALNALYPAAFPTDSFYMKISSHLIVVGIVGTILSKLTVVDNTIK